MIKLATKREETQRDLYNNVIFKAAETELHPKYRLYIFLKMHKGIQL